jgi:hypothetical protein
VSPANNRIDQCVTPSLAGGGSRIAPLLILGHQPPDVKELMTRNTRSSGPEKWAELCIVTSLLRATMRFGRCATRRSIWEGDVGLRIWYLPSCEQNVLFVLVRKRGRTCMRVS